MKISFTQWNNDSPQKLLRGGIPSLSITLNSISIASSARQTHFHLESKQSLYTVKEGVSETIQGVPELGHGMERV